MVAALTMVWCVAGCAGRQAPPPIPVATTAGPEAELVAHLYASALGFYGSAAQVRVVDDPLAGLDSGEATVVPGWTGRLLARFDPDAPARSDVQVYRSLLSALPEGVAAGDYTTAAEDKPALAMTAAESQKLGADTATLARRCPAITVGAVSGTTWPTSIGTCALPTVRQFDDAATLFAALRSGRVDAAWTSTAAAGVPSEAVVLSDKTSLIRAENLVPLYRRNVLSESQVLALNEIAGVLDTGSLADMRREIAEGAEPGRVAAQWLEAHPLGTSN
nr:glycine betaine ABC transporter substrate-binding protein [Mycolicibacterium obuense]